MNNDFLLAKLTQMLLQQHGIKAPNYKNLQSLSDNLISQKNVHLSPNTLARLVGLKNESRIHYKNTLDSLAIAAGFLSYEHYVNIFQFKKRSYLSDASWNSADFIYSYTEKAARTNDRTYISSLNDFITQHGCPVDTMLQLGLALTKGLRANNQPEKIIPSLVENSIYIDLLFETYVDIDHLAGYYGKAMLLLSDQAETESRTWLFSNILAWHYSKMISDVKRYEKYGLLITAYAGTHSKWLLEINCIFPYARLVSAAIHFSIEQNMTFKADIFFDEMIAAIANLTPDDAIVVISQVSDISPLLKPSQWKLLIAQFKRISKEVRFERDSLINAAINLSLMKKEWLIDPVEMKAEWEHHPIQFFACGVTLRNKFMNTCAAIGV